MDFIGKTIFGICLGLQVLLKSPKKEKRKDWGFFRVLLKFKSGSNLKVPHIGGIFSWESKFSSPIAKGSKMVISFFVHSFHVVVQDPSLSCLRTTYGYEFVSGVIHQNCVATQFHRKKSGKRFNLPKFH